MSSSFFSPSSNTESRGRSVKQNRPGQRNPRGRPVQESGGGSERELGAWLYRVQGRR